MNDFGKVSVIIPVYNAEKFLNDCIQSVLQQDYSNIELILVNDGSKDSSPDICKRYVESDSRVLYLSQENSGVSATRNHGIDAASGDYVMFVDSDDKLKPRAISMLVSKCKEQNVDLVGCGYEIVYSDRAVPMQIKSVDVFGEQELAAYFSEHFLEAIASSVWGKLYKKNLISHRFNKNVTMGEDLLFNLYYLQNAHSFSSVEDTLYEYNRLNPDSLVRNYKIEYYAQDVFVCREWLRWFESLGLERHLTKNAHYHISRSFYVYVRFISESKTLNDKLKLVENSVDEGLIESIKFTLDSYNVFQRQILKYIVHRKYKLVLWISSWYSLMRGHK